MATALAFGGIQAWQRQTKLQAGDRSPQVVGNAGEHRCPFLTVGSQALHHRIEPSGDALYLRGTLCLEGRRVVALTNASQAPLQTTQWLFNVLEQIHHTGDDHSPHQGDQHQHRIRWPAAGGWDRATQPDRLEG